MKIVIQVAVLLVVGCAEQRSIPHFSPSPVGDKRVPQALAVATSPAFAHDQSTRAKPLISSGQATPCTDLTAASYPSTRISSGYRPIAQIGPFPHDQSSLDRRARQRLGTIANYLSSQDAAANPLILVVGHSDSVGDAGYNLRLSRARADSVAYQLIARGVERSWIRTLGMGEQAPLSVDWPNEDVAGNRRVDILIRTRADAGSIRSHCHEYSGGRQGMMPLLTTQEIER